MRVRVRVRARARVWIGVALERMSCTTSSIEMTMRETRAASTLVSIAMFNIALVSAAST